MVTRDPNLLPAFKGRISPVVIADMGIAGSASGLRKIGSACPNAHLDRVLKIKSIATETRAPAVEAAIAITDKACSMKTRYISAPAIVASALLCSAAGAAPRGDANGDGRLSLTEFQTVTQKRLMRADKDADGSITDEEQPSRKGAPKNPDGAAEDGSDGAALNSHEEAPETGQVN